MSSSSFLSPEPELYVPIPLPLDAQPQEIWGTLYNKFYDWHYHECLSLLEGLKVYPADLDDDDPTAEHLDQTAQSSRSTTSRNRDRGLDSEYFELVDFDEDGEEDNSTIVEAIVEDGPADRRHNRTWKPNPRYTTCTPLASSTVNFGASWAITARFPCYSDDPTFDLRKYLSFHYRFAWQTDFWDPDHEIIKVELARLLHFQQDLRLLKIDDLRLPTFMKMRRTSTDGLVWQASQRDALSWPESQLSPWPQLTLGHVREAFSPTEQDIFSQVRYASTVFCPNLGCLASSSETCELHRVPAIREQIATLATTEYARGRDCCGDQCFLYIEDELQDDREVVLDALLWPEGTQELDALASILKISPDALPCDLSVICRSPCNQIFANRRKLISDEDILDDRSDDPEPVILPAHYLDIPVDGLNPETGEPDFRRPVLPYQPCSHAGPCRKGVCSCFDESFHCDRNCRCSFDCPNRWKGCTCKRSKKKRGKRSGTGGLCTETTEEDGCECRKASRECEPDLCLGCDARLGKKCQNTGVQHGKFARIEVSRSDYGYGAFATENIPASTYIGDYVGDIEDVHGDSPAAEVITMIRDHIDLNYAFGLYDHLNVAIDSRSAGNETRYLNHSVDEFNCSANVVAVYSTYHIVLVTNENSNIKAGQELLLNYGEKYWNADGKEKPETKKQTKTVPSVEDNGGSEVEMETRYPPQAAT